MYVKSGVLTLRITKIYWGPSSKGQLVGYLKVILHMGVGFSS